MRERQRTQLKGGGDWGLADSEMMAAAFPALSTSGPTSAHLWISNRFILSLHQLRVCAAAFRNQSQISSVSSLLSLLFHNLQCQQKELQRSDTHTHTHSCISVMKNKLHPSLNGSDIIMLPFSYPVQQPVMERPCWGYAQCECRHRSDDQ